MFIVETYSSAIVLCFITMLCWGSWANTQKLTKTPFQLFYWDYGLGLLILSLVAAFTLGSHGESGRGFLDDIYLAQSGSILYALFAGIIFNLANLLLVAAIDLTGMSVAFPLAIGLSLVIGVVINYLAQPIGNAKVLGCGIVFIILAMIFSARAYAKLESNKHITAKHGITIALISGVLMGLFFRFIAASISENYVQPEIGKLTPYTAFVIFSCGVVLSSFIFNTWMIQKPITGKKIVGFKYSTLSIKSHMIGILGGMIWAVGTLLSLLASNKAGFAISYGLGQGATMIAALWGVFIWHEFKNAPKGTNLILSLMFVAYLLGLSLIVISRVV